jgi:PAS domain S-box-containing protein
MDLNTQYFLATIVESSDDAIISKTLDGIITSWNKGAEKIFGYKADEVIGKSIVILMPPNRENEEPGILEKLRRGEKIDHYETVRITKDGRLLDISITVSPVKDSKGNIIGASKIARDITEKKKAEREIRQFLEQEQDARREAEEANRIKDEFIATVSHELRTPLTAMLGWVRLLRTGELSPETANNALETIERNVKSQAQLIEDLLDVSRITTGKLRLILQPVDLGSVVKSATDAVRPAASAKNIKLQMILGDEAPVYGDYERLQQIIWNLLSNAIKFTPKGGKAQIEVNRVDSHIELTVTDTGEGIKAEFLPYIFNRFTQADSSISRPYGGLGLGLSIAKHIAELHGGTVKAFSEGEGKGATFTVILPVMAIKSEVEKVQLQKSNTANIKISNQNNELSGQKLLVVDDEPDTLVLIKAIFEQYGAEVEIAQSVDLAIEILEKWKPTILVSDISMPGRNGFDLIQYVRARSVEKGGNIPAVALTAFARVEDRVKVLSAGYQMHIPKPVEPTELVSIVTGLTKIIH